MNTTTDRERLLIRECEYRRATSLALMRVANDLLAATRDPGFDLAAYSRALHAEGEYSNARYEEARAELLASLEQPAPGTIAEDPRFAGARIEYLEDGSFRLAFPDEEVK